MKKGKKKFKRKTERKVYGWSLWREGVSASFLYDFLCCRFQTRLKYLENWSPRISKPAPEAGSCYHYVMQRIYSCKKKITNNLISKFIKDYEKEWKARVGRATQYQLQAQELIYVLVEASFRAYIVRWNGDFTGKYTYGNSTVQPKKWLALEQKNEAVFEYPDGKQAILKATFDGLFQDKRKDIWLFESKSKGRIDEGHPYWEGEGLQPRSGPKGHHHASEPLLRCGICVRGGNSHHEREQ